MYPFRFRTRPPPAPSIGTGSRSPISPLSPPLSFSILFLRASRFLCRLYERSRSSIFRLSGLFVPKLFTQGGSSVTSVVYRSTDRRIWRTQSWGFHCELLALDDLLPSASYFGIKRARFRILRETSRLRLSGCGCRSDNWVVGRVVYGSKCTCESPSSLHACFSSSFSPRF